MRKILVLTIVLMLLVLSVAPVSAQTPQVTIQGSGKLMLPLFPDSPGYPGYVEANVTVHLDTATGKFRITQIIPRGFMLAPEVRAIGVYAVGEVTDWEVDGNSVSVEILFDGYFLLPGQPPVLFVEDFPFYLEGLLTGPGNRGEITFPDIGTIPGTIVMH